VTETSQTTPFPPAAVPDGVEVINGTKYMRDAQRHLVPLDVIKPADKLQDEAVRKVMGHALALSGQLERFKAHTMADLTALDALLEQEFQVTKRGNRGRGNRTYMSYDGLFRVQVAMADTIDFGPQLQVAKTLIDECLTEWAEESRPEIRAIVTRAFNTDKEGQINKSEVFMLLRLDITDPRWLRAMEAIRDAIRVVGRKEYVRFGQRASASDDFQSVTINLAQA
jgi:hypothetical protein